MSLADALFWGFVTAIVVTGIFFAAHYLPPPALADLRGGRRGHPGAALVLLRRRQPAAPRQLLDPACSSTSRWPTTSAPSPTRSSATAAPPTRPSAGASPTTTRCSRSSTARRCPSAGRCCCWPPCTTCCCSGAEHPLAALLRHGAPSCAAGTAGTADGGRRHRLRRLLPGAPRRARRTDRHPHDPDQRGRALHRPAARPLPRRRALRLAGAALPARPRHLGRPQPALRRLRLHLPGRRRTVPDSTAGTCRALLSPSSARPGTTRPTCPTSRLPAMADAGRPRPRRPSTRAPTTRPAGCWPASGRTTRPLRTPAGRAGQRARQRPTRPGSSSGDMMTDLPRWSPTMPG